jgi:hypothetical protein
MTRRVFVATLRTGLASATTSVAGARPAFAPTVTFEQDLADQTIPHRFAGPALQVIGPGDVLGIDRAHILREEPAAGTVDAVENNLVTLDLADAALPWLVSLPGMKDRPWIALVVLREDEGNLADAAPLPVVTVPTKALPDLADLASWTHVEARLEDGEQLASLLDTESRLGTDRVVARLICPRRLEAGTGWLVCLVPATRAGIVAGLGGQPGPGDAGQPGWSLTGGPQRLPVYHSWRFRTGDQGSFEDMARRIHPVPATTVPGFGSRTISVRRPWPHEDLLEGAPDTVTVSVQGALRLPGSAAPVEQWTDPPTQQRFLGLLEDALDAPGREAAAARDGDRDAAAVAPPILGSHHTGHRAVPQGGWMRQLNLEVRHRVAASLGSRYVQVEQEFLMERAWEQVGEVREANRILAAAELATESGLLAQAKHLGPMTGIAMTQLSDPLRSAVKPVETVSLGQLLSTSAAPAGTGSTAFRRVARGQGALARRTARTALAVDNAVPHTEPVLSDGLAGTPAAPLRPEVSVAAGTAMPPPVVALDRATLYGSGTMLSLLGAQSTIFRHRDEELFTSIEALTSGFGDSMGAAMVLDPIASGTLRMLRARVLDTSVPAMPVTEVSTRLGIQEVAAGIRSAIRPLAQQLSHMDRLIETTLPATRLPEAARPLGRIMAHPRFGFPIGAELLGRWPEWTVPGITTFPENSATVLETNPEFVEAALVGLNQELNRELLWREYPTDQAGTPFARFWPGGAGQFGEIASWGDDGSLGSHDPLGGAARLVVLVRADVLKRYPGTLLFAVKSESRRVPAAGVGWKDPLFTLPVDDHTTVFGFDLTVREAREQLYLFVLREPMRGTQFGFDLKTPDSPALIHWADLTWDDVPLRRSFVDLRPAPASTPRPSQADAGDPVWTPDPIDVARIAFQRPFQVAFSPTRLIGP